MVKVSAFGEWLSAQMGREELNPAGLAELLDVSHVTIHKWMYGQSTPREANVRKLARALQVDPVDVYRAITGTMHDSQMWPEDVHAVIQDYLALPPKARRAFRNMARAPRGRHLAVTALPDKSGSF